MILGYAQNDDIYIHEFILLNTGRNKYQGRGAALPCSRFLINKCKGHKRGIKK